MKISYNWLKEYLNITDTPETIGETLTDLGLELEGLEHIEAVKGGLEGVVTGLVLDCWRHPNADKLSLTKVDIGTGETLQIVCGAPNVAAGQKVLIATVGATLYPVEGDPIKLKKGKIRGEDSEGMICAEDELGLGSDHSGIMVLPADTPVGLPARAYFKLENDAVFEIGLTPNRTDATNHLGVAKDLAARLRFEGKLTSPLRIPDVSAFKTISNAMKIDVAVENTEACPRYSGVCIEGLTIADSPDWLKQRLLAVGVRPINNVVDATNFVLHELGQPLHAFDYDAIAGHKILVKTLPAGSKFVSLDEVTRTLTAHDLMICDGQSNGMCIGGVFGGLHSGVKTGTSRIFLESAHFNAKYIRRSSMHHDLRTDAARIFEKGSDPNMTVFALKRAALLICELAGGRIASDVIDIYPNPVQAAKVSLTYKNIDRLLGVHLPVEVVKHLLSALEMDIVGESADGLSVLVPTNKADVTREADVIEEMLRIYGYNNIPEPSQIHTAVTHNERPDPNQIRNKIGDYLSALGYSEMMGLSLSPSKYYLEYLQIPQEEIVFVNNTSNVSLDTMRPSMLMTGLETVVHNQNRQQGDLKLFEFGRSYRKNGDDFREDQHLTIFLCGQKQPDNWHNKQKDPNTVSFFTLKTVVENILQQLGVQRYQETVIENQDGWSSGVQYHRGAQNLLRFGQLQGKLLRNMGAKGPVFYAEFNWNNVLNAMRQHKVVFEELNRFPTVRRDLAMVIDNSVKFGEIAAIAAKVGKKFIKQVNLFDVFEDEQKLGAGKKSYAVSFIFEDPTRTLQDKEVDQVMERLITTFEMQLQAAIRR